MSNKKTKKRASCFGFSRENMVESLAKIEKRGIVWRKTQSKTLVMTVLMQKFSHTSGAETIIKHLCPWGMKEVMTSLFTEPRCLNKQALPNKLKEEHPLITSDKYDKKEWKITVANSGPLQPEKYYRLYCDHCETKLLPGMLERYSDRLGDMKNLVGLINNWDILKIPQKEIDYVGCFLPWKEDIQAGPNSRKFIRDPSEHPKTSHIYTVDGNASKSKLKRQATLPQMSNSKTPPVKVIVLDKEPGPSSQSTISAKTAKKHLKQGTLDKALGVIPLKGKTDQQAHLRAKSYCLSIIHRGVGKAISEKTIIEMYQSGYEGQLLFRGEVENEMLSKYPAAVKSIPPVVKVQLNSHNIESAENAILAAYKHDDEGSLYRKLEKSPFFSLMHDGISKFSVEYNGVYLRGLDESHNPINVPYCLSKMKVN